MASGGSPVCAQCNKAITGTYTTALGKTWHKEHFICFQCNKPFNGATFFVEDQKPYCEEDHKKLFQNKGSNVICAQCNKPITGTYTTALGKTWHKEHFVCAQCKKPFNGATFFVEDEKPYCEADHKKLFQSKNQASGGSAICAQCNKPISGTITTALGKTWHKEHFVCAHCKKPFNGAAFFVEDEKPYCEADHKKLFQSKTDQSSRICAQCNKPISGTVTTAMGQTWHKEHFVCTQCKKPFNGAVFYVEDGKPYCESDHKKHFQNVGNETSGGNSICAQCNKPITGTFITAMGKTWHKEHFVCAHCNKPINCSTPFFVKEGKPYCEADHKKLFKGDCYDASGGYPICAHCNQPITDKVLTALGKQWHKDHFLCAHCKKPIQGSDFNANDGKPYCDKDYNALFRKKCSGCGEMIQDTVLTALDKHWHKKCFTCNKCGKPINAQQGCTEKNGKPFCVACAA